MLMLIFITMIAFIVASPVQFTGVSLSCAEFAPNAIPGTDGKDYTWATQQEVDYFSSLGMNAIRVPFLWERIQPIASGELDLAYSNNLVSLISYITSKGVTAIVDPHNYARYYGHVVGQSGSGVSAADLANLWVRLSTLPTLINNDKVVFAIMNEPNTMKTEDWVNDANAVAAAIRGAGANNTLTIPGNAWTGAHSWTENWYGTSNSVAMLHFKDPAHNFVFEVHQYLDSDASGTSPDCKSATTGSQQLADFTAWCKTNNFRAFLGEFGAGNNPTCQSAVADMLTYMENNRDVYWGWTWWAGGPWWGSYFTSIEPNNGQDAPQVAWLKPHLAGNSNSTTTFKCSQGQCVPAPGGLSKSTCEQVCS